LNTTTLNINHDGFDTTMNNTTDKNGAIKIEIFQTATLLQIKCMLI
jgi:hypothetical protein